MNITMKNIKQNIIKKSLLFLAMTVILFSSLIAAADEPSKSPRIKIKNPRAGEVWMGVNKIEVEVKNIELVSLRSINIYLDGRLIKELSEPPFRFKYNFGRKPKYMKLEALATARTVAGTQRFRDSIRSYRADDFQVVDVMQIVLPVVVMDRRGNYISGLKKSDFVVREDSVKQDVSYFSTSGKSTFRLALLIDISSSMKDKISEVKQVAKTFLRQLLRVDDQAIVLFFNHDVFEDSEFTNNLRELDNSLNIAMPFGATALYDAVAYSVKLLKSIIGQNIIILFSDGEDNSSTIDPYTLMKIVERSNSVIYAIGKGMGELQTQYKELLERISTSSGGMTFFFEDVEDLEKLYTKIRRDIQAKYILQFAPKNAKKQNRFRKISIKLSKEARKKYGRGIRIRTMKGYFY